MAPGRTADHDHRRWVYTVEKCSSPSKADDDLSFGVEDHPALVVLPSEVINALTNSVQDEDIRLSEHGSNQRTTGTVTG